VSESGSLRHELLTSPSARAVAAAGVRVWQITSGDRTPTHGTDRRGRGLMLPTLSGGAPEIAARKMEELADRYHLSPK